MTTLTASLFLPVEHRPQVSEFWCETRDADPAALALFLRHYSVDHRRRDVLAFVGPGEKLVLITPEASALFVWRREVFRRDGQQGINCAVFRNEGAVLSSELIRDACRLAWDRWPAVRLFTFVSPRRVRSTNPGYCFQKAGWKRCGTSKEGLLIFEILPAEEPLRCPN